MNLITLDFETFYGGDYTLSKMTTEEYVRDPRFETIMVGIKNNDGPSMFIPKTLVPQWLEKLEIHKNAVCCHHANFDGLILSHHYNAKPKMWFDTLSMARALHGANARLSLAKLAEHYGLQAKGTEVHNMKDKHFDDLSFEELTRYGEYCCNDVDITYQLFQCMRNGFCKTEFEIIDRVIRMFTEPVLQLDVAMLEHYRKTIVADKTTELTRAGIQLADVMSNDKFAEILVQLGIDPPMKISPTTGKETYAFAKTDPGLQELEDHPDERVQAVVAARLKNKSTLAEKRAERMISMQSRGDTCIYLKYSGASGSHRFSGGDKMNWQNLTRGSALRNALMAPPGKVCVVGDSSNIEARLLDWLAGQDDMVQVYRDADAGVGPDIYCVVAGRIYKRQIVKAVDKDERQVGKCAKLGLGYGMGADKFITAVRGQAKDTEGKPLVLSRPFAVDVVNIYREAHPYVRAFWKRGEEALKAIARKQINVPIDHQGIVKTCADGVVLPNGLKLLFPDLRFDKNDGQYGEWSFWNGKMREHIYGAKLVENLIQALARIIVIEQSRLAARELGSWVHSVHDEAVLVADEFDAPYVLGRLLWHMRQPLDWCQSLPLNSEGGFHQRYGKAK